MNHETHSFSSSKTTPPIQVNLDDFNISEDSFKPMTKGLGFHQEQKRTSFKATPKEVKPFGSTRPLAKLTSATKSTQHIPTGLEAFYSTKATTTIQVETVEKVEGKVESQKKYKTAGMPTQFFAWGIDVLVIASFVAVTGALLVLASGIQYRMFAKLISNQDLAVFSAAIFSIYYLLYFTILDLTASPGKTICGLRLVKADNSQVSVKNTFMRAFVSLVSSIALFLPMLLDFQGRLSDTKVVKQLAALSKDTILFLEKNKSKKIVFTNGCFDILHLGHVEYLNEAKALGDVLIIGLNSDASIKELKGADRPINSEIDRKEMLLNLRAVDCVQVFTEQTPEEIIKLIKPNVLVKGGDWKIEEILGSDFVLANGGEVKSLHFKEGYSTSKLIQAVQGKQQSVKIHFKSETDCDYFFFNNTNYSPLVVLPENIQIKDLICFIQSSLDQIKPVVLLISPEYLSDIKLSELRAFHHKISPAKFVFLNYSIRNSLTSLVKNNSIIKNFSEIELILKDHFKK